MNDFDSLMECGICEFGKISMIQQIGIHSSSSSFNLNLPPTPEIADDPARRLRLFLHKAIESSQPFS